MLVKKMKKNNKVNLYIKILIHIFIILMFELYIQSLSTNIHSNIKLVTLILILLVILISIIIDKKKKLSTKNITNIIIIIGILLRTMYIIYTPITERQHDVDYFNYEGHLSYINTIYETGKLPETNAMQYYHPPLHHIIGAGWLKINEIFFNTPLMVNIENLQILTLLFSSLTLYVISLILSRIKIKDKYKHLINIFFSVHPTFIILSGSINNDCLEYLFQFLILLYILKYYEKPTLKNSIILGIITGLCMLTKFNGLIMLGPITIMFLYKIYKDKKINEALKNYGICIIIALILGLSFQIRSILLFGSNAIPEPGDFLSLKNYNIIERMVIPSITTMFDKFCKLPGDYNLFAYIVKSSIFGEYHFNISNVFYYSYLIVNLFLILFSTILIIKNIKNIFKDKILLLLITNYFINIISYLYFNYKYPFICTMDFRYIVPTLMTGITLLVLESNNTSNKRLSIIIDISIIIFIILSLIFLFLI